MRIIKVAQSTIKTPSLSAVTMFKPYTLSGELWFMDSTTGVTVRYLAACQTNPLRDSPFIIPRYTRATTGFALALYTCTRITYTKNHEDTSRRMNIQRIPIYPSLWSFELRFTKQQAIHGISKVTIITYQIFFIQKFN